MNIMYTFLRKSLLALLAIVIFGCGNNDAEMKKLREENEALKNSQIKREQIAKEAEIQKQKEAQKAEMRKLHTENEALQKQIAAQKAKSLRTIKNKKTEPIVKTGKVIVSIEVENYKPNGRKWDSTGAPDISGKITFPDGSVIVIHKHNNSYTASGSVENVKLRKNDRIKVLLEDRDISSNDIIASGSVVYPGGSIFKQSIGSAHLIFKFE